MPPALGLVKSMAAGMAAGLRSMLHRVFHLFPAIAMKIGHFHPHVRPLMRPSVIAMKIANFHTHVRPLMRPSVILAATGIQNPFLNPAWCGYARVVQVGRRPVHPASPVWHNRLGACPGLWIPAAARMTGVAVKWACGLPLRRERRASRPNGPVDYHCGKSGGGI